MKKIFYLLIGLLLLPSIVNADMASPVVVKYKLTVTNPDGVDAYKYDSQGENYVKTGEKIPYGTVVESNPEYEDIAVLCVDEKCNSFVYVKDLVLVEKEYKIKDSEKGDKNDALALQDIVIKKGPAEVYEKTNTTIKAGTKFTAIDMVIDEGVTPWYYVEYNGTKGYVNSYGGTMAFNISEVEIITASKIEILDPITNSVLKTIEPSTKIKTNIGSLDDWSSSLYIEYDGVKGIIDKSYIIKKEEIDEFKYETDTNIYDYVDIYEPKEEQNAKVIGTIPANTAFTSEYYDFDYDGIIYYEKDGIKGWVINNYDNWHDNKKATEQEQKNDNKKEENKQVKPKKDYTLYICIGAGIIVSITAIVIVILINQKKKSDIEL